MGFLTAALITTSVASSVASGVAKRRAANFGTNEAARLAADATARGEEDVSAYRTDLAQLIGRQRTSMAAQGLDLTQGSAAGVQADAARTGAIDIERIRENARREAYGYRAQGEMNARALRAGATGDFVQAGATLATAGVDAYQNYTARKGINTATTASRRAGANAFARTGRTSSTAARPSFGYARP